jgi:hypothetical protein
MTTATENKSGANNNSGQSSQAGKLDALIADLDFSDVPEAVRDSVIAKVKDKVRLYDSSYRAKTEMISEEKKRVEADRQSIKALLDIQRELKDNPNMEKAVIQVINDFRSGKTHNSETNRDANIKRLDKLIDNAGDPDTREQLREMRQIVIEETDAPALKAKMNELEEEIKRLKSSSLNGHAEKVDTEIDLLEKKYGKEFISKYREDIKASALKYPHQKVGKLLYHFADDSELEEAIFKVAEEKKKKELEIKKNGSLPDGRSMSTKVDVPKDSHGRVSWRGLINNMKTAGKFSS